ncbi:uncharacterized protein LOC118193740, partial [Stegodyphus dumicola]|uniref:uncharacterized protein LOC118193740 n=1 Tax=Stegodyphus dumicola TaxID=202533 RepID=UPI0015A94299
MPDAGKGNLYTHLLSKFNATQSVQLSVTLTALPMGLGSNPPECIHVCKRIVSVWHGDIQNIRQIKCTLKRLMTASEYGLELNICQFLKREIEFLGHKIKDGKLYPSSSKTKAVINSPEPKCVKDVQSYLGLTGYFRKFIPNYSLIAKPLNDLLKKDSKFKFETKELYAFNELKRILTSEPVLCIYNPKAETEIHTDASADGYGAVLLQKSLIDIQMHPVYYMSRKTTDIERKYSSYELEVKAIVSLKKFRVYVLGIPFKIVTDCNAFKQTMSKKDICTKISRWALMLQDYDYTIEHRSGTRMGHVDALSRNPVCMVIQDEKIEKCITNCITCILANRKSGKKEGLLHPLPKEDIPLNAYLIDHLGPLESFNKNYKYIFAVIDSVTKFVWLHPTKTTSSKEVIDKLEIQKSLFGNPCNIVADRGTAFTSQEFAYYCTKENIHLSLITTGLPRANGQVERLNSTIISVISKLAIDDPTKWYKHVNDVQQINNSTFQRSINSTPFELLFGTKIKTNKDRKIKELIEVEIQKDFIESRENLRKEAKEQIRKIQEENRKTYNRSRKLPRKYKINDMVAIKRAQLGPGIKLKSKFLGPYKITKVKPNDTYDVEK